jgi:Planctomycete cytochrome C
MSRRFSFTLAFVAAMLSHSCAQISAETLGWDFFDQHCFDCHDADEKKGGLDLTSLALKLDADANVHVLDLWSDFTNADGTTKTALDSDGHLHLGADGYELYASKLQPVVEALMKK